MRSMLADRVPAGGETVAPHPATEAGLVHVSDEMPGIRRIRSGKGFRYRRANGKTVTDPATLDRIRALAIPPAYTDVWICPIPNGHIQATGRDARGRKQYRYHANFRTFQEETKYEHILEFAALLPGIRTRIDADMALRGLSREKVLATIVHLLEATMIRVGNTDYAKSNGSFGLTTLRDRHVEVSGTQLRFRFRGKHGREWNLKVSDRRIARIVKASQDLPGQHLFQYLDDEGKQREVTSTDVNSYLREITGRDITAKDFRTWCGTVLAAVALAEFEEVDSHASAKRNVRAAIERVAMRLGNTPTICRKCYVHPQILESYLDRNLALGTLDEVKAELRDDLSGLRPEEALVLAFLRHRLGQKAAEAS